MRFHQFRSSAPTTGEAMKATAEIAFACAPTFPEMVAKHPNPYFEISLASQQVRSIPNNLKPI